MYKVAQANCNNAQGYDQLGTACTKVEADGRIGELTSRNSLATSMWGSAADGRLHAERNNLSPLHLLGGQPKDQVTAAAAANLQRAEGCSEKQRLPGVVANEANPTSS